MREFLHAAHQARRFPRLNRHPPMGRNKNAGRAAGLLSMLTTAFILACIGLFLRGLAAFVEVFRPRK